MKEEALNLVPIMNLVTILIPFLLTALKSVELAIIETKLPAISQGGPPPDDVPDKPPLSLTLALTGTGVRILAKPDYLGLGEATPAMARYHPWSFMGFELSPASPSTRSQGSMETHSLHGPPGGWHLATNHHDVAPAVHP